MNELYCVQAWDGIMLGANNVQQEEEDNQLLFDPKLLVGQMYYNGKLKEQADIGYFVQNTWRKRMLSSHTCIPRG